jgi:hypothetical protein
VVGEETWDAGEGVGTGHETSNALVGSEYDITCFVLHYIPGEQ